MTDFEEKQRTIMIFKDDDGWWRIMSGIGLGISKFKTYEDAVHSLPKYLWEGLL